MQKQVFLITGAAGFIGSHLVDHLLSQEHEVWGVDNLITGNTNNLTQARNNPNFHFIHADVTQAPDLYLPENFYIKIPNQQLNSIYHLASIASPPLYQQYPRETYLVNVVATDALLEFIKDHSPATKFIYASTSEVYGDPLEHPQKESYWGNVNPNGDRSCYDESKRMGETVCGVFTKKYGIDTRIARIFNTYGPRMDTNDGRIIPNFITQALSTKKLTIYGDGSQTRSFCYIDDTIKGLVIMSQLSNLIGKTINIGNPEEYNVFETARLIYQAVAQTDVEPLFDYQKLPNDDPTRRRPDISLAKSLLDWQPTTDFKTGISRTIAWFQNTSHQ